MSTPADCEIICYADDTLVIAGGKGMEEAVDRAEIVVNMIARKIRWMGLQIAAEKSEAVRFRRKGEQRNKENKGIVIESTRISIGYSMKYLGLLVLDTGRSGIIWKR